MTKREFETTVLANSIAACVYSPYVTGSLDFGQVRCKQVCNCIFPCDIESRYTLGVPDIRFDISEEQPALYKGLDGFQYQESVYLCLGLCGDSEPNPGNLFFRNAIYLASIE